jgi:hypothetical protein
LGYISVSRKVRERIVGDIERRVIEEYRNEARGGLYIYRIDDWPIMCYGKIRGEHSILSEYVDPYMFPEIIAEMHNVSRKDMLRFYEEAYNQED